MSTSSALPPSAPHAPPMQPPLQGSFWEYHHALFADGHHRTEANLSEEALIALAGDVGLDTEKFAG